MRATCPAGDSLQKLTLNDNPILELDKDSFRGLLLLRELNISAMSHLTRIGPSTFTHLRSLEMLFCSYNHNLTEIDEEAFGYVDDEWTLKEVPSTFCLVPYHTGDRGGTVVKVLRYKLEGRWFNSRWCHWNFSLT